MFSSTTCLTVVFSCGMAPAPYFRRRTVRDHSLLFFTFVLYNIYFILGTIPYLKLSAGRAQVLTSRSSAWQVEEQPLLYRQLRIP